MLNLNCYDKVTDTQQVMNRLKKATTIKVIHSHHLGKSILEFMSDNNINYELIEFDFQKKAQLADKLAPALKDNELIVIASFYQAWIYKWLSQDLGLSYLKDVLFFEHLEFSKLDGLKDGVGIEFYEYVTEHTSRFEAAYDALSDDASKQLFEDVINYRTNQFALEQLAPERVPLSLEEQLKIENGTKDYLAQLSETVPERLRSNVAFKLSVDEYSYKDKVSATDKKAILNCGAYNNSSLVFSHLSPRAKVYAFEPQDEIHAQNLEIAKTNSNIHPVNFGLWSKKCTLNFNHISDASGSSTGSRISSEATSNCSSIEVTSIDEFAREQNLDYVDFIKMDVEGAELEALDGAVETIRKYKPQLAISIYHMPEHIYAVPLKIKQILPEYSLYIGHRYPSVCETVCFAVVE